VRPNTITLPLSEGDWILVKERLNAGEQRKLVEASRFDTPDADGLYQIDPTRAGLALILAYLIDWSFTGFDGAPMAIKGLTAEELQRTVDNLEPPDYSEIRNAINAHTASLFAAREAEKKRMAGENGSSTISTSPGVVTGAMSG